MIKGVVLGICSGIFISSFLIFLFGLSGNLQPNLMTGNVIGTSDAIGISFLTMVFSGLSGLAILARMLK